MNIVGKLTGKLNFTIRVKLLLLAGSILLLLVASNLYLRDGILTGNVALSANSAALKAASDALLAGNGSLSANSTALKQNSDALVAGVGTLESDVAISNRLAIANQTIQSFARLSYWLTDLAVSFLNESEENAEAAAEELEQLLGKLAEFQPENVPLIRGHVAQVTEKAIEAVDAYADDNRVLGNSLLADTRDGILGVEEILNGIVNELRAESEAAKKQAVDSAKQALAPAQKAVEDAEKALESAQQAAEVANAGVLTADSAIEKAEFAGSISVFTPIISVLIAIVITWLIMRSITKPMADMTNAMRRLADGDLELDIPATDKKDEIGAMAGAVQVFKENAIEMKRLEGEQVESQKRAEAEQRDLMNKLADDFDQRASRE